MLIALWIINIILALLMLGAGFAKATSPKAKLAENPRMAWTEDFSPLAIRLIGIAEVLGGLGLILPLATGIAPILTPIAAERRPDEEFTLTASDIVLDRPRNRDHGDWASNIAMRLAKQIGTLNAERKNQLEERQQKFAAALKQMQGELQKA